MSTTRLESTPRGGAAGDRAAVPRGLLVAGLLVGIAAAAASLVVGDERDAIPPQAVAMVNSRPILRDAWLRAVAAVASERRTPLTAADQRHILERLVDEELLVQHGIALGLPERDARLRSTLVSEVMAAARPASGGVDEAALRTFYADHPEYFASPGRLRVEAQRLAADGRAEPFLPPLPDALLPPAKLQTYLGPALTAAAMNLAPGDAVELDSGNGQRVRLRMHEREAGAVPRYEDVRVQVLAEWKRRADEDAVRELLLRLRAGGSIRVAPELP